MLIWNRSSWFASAIASLGLLLGCGSSGGAPAADEPENAAESSAVASRFAGSKGFIASAVAPSAAGEIACLQGPEGHGIVMAGVIDPAQGGMELVARLASLREAFDATPLEIYLSLSRTTEQQAAAPLLANHYALRDEAPRILHDAPSLLRTEAVNQGYGFPTNPNCDVFPMDFQLNSWIPNYRPETHHYDKNLTIAVTENTLEHYGPHQYATWICGRTGQALYAINFRAWVEYPFVGWQLAYDWTLYAQVTIVHGQHAFLWYVPDPGDPVWQLQTKVTNNTTAAMSYDLATREQNIGTPM